MSRLIIALIIIFLILTVIRSMLIRFRSQPEGKNKKERHSVTGKNGTNKSGEIDDAKFEEIK